MTALNPQEVYLLERYASKDYFVKLRDAWQTMIKHVESCLQVYVQNSSGIPRSQLLSERPDIVWTERVLPNFRSTLASLNKGLALLHQGDPEGLGYASGPLNDFKGQMDYWTGWMLQPDENRYGYLLHESVTLASNIQRTEGAYWEPHDLANYCEEWGPLDPPPQWPSYRINKTITAVSGQRLKQPGVYIPDTQNSCAQFLSTSYDEVPPAIVLVGTQDILDDTTGEKYDEERLFEEKVCVWHLVERDAEAARSEHSKHAQFRLAAGAPCPETGFYFTPAHPASRRLFNKGESMPDIDSAYGSTIWQWDSKQT